MTIQPEMLAATASQFEDVGTVMAIQNAVAAGLTAGVVPPAIDDVSALTATQFGAHAAIHETFMPILGASAGSYATTEAVNASAAI